MEIHGTVENAKEVVGNIMDVADRIRAEVHVQMEDSMVELYMYITGAKLSGQVLNVRTGRLRAAVGSRVYESGDEVIGEVYVPLDKVPYARLQEMGGKTKAHIIRPKVRKALRFIGADGDEVITSLVNHPGSVMPERSFMRSGLHDMTTRILNDLNDAIARAVNK